MAKAVLAAAVPPYLYKSDDNPDGGLDDDTIKQFEDGVRSDRIAFLDGFTADFFNPGGKGLLGSKSGAVSEAQRQYAVRLAEVASPKATLDCIAAFGRTDFRGDVAQIERADAGHPRGLRRDRPVRGERQARARADPRQRARASSRVARTASTRRTPSSSTGHCWTSSPADRPPGARHACPGGGLLGVRGALHNPLSVVRDAAAAGCPRDH